MGNWEDLVCVINNEVDVVIGTDGFDGVSIESAKLQHSKL
jgi:hypothetical protein